MVNMKFPRLDVKLLRGKAHYFFYFGGTAGVLPYLQVIAKQMGVSAAGVGLLYTVLPFVALVSKPITSGIADKYRKKKCMLMVALLTMVVCLFSINFIPHIHSGPQQSASPAMESTVDLTASLECSGSNGLWVSVCGQNEVLLLPKNDRLLCYASCPVDARPPCSDPENCDNTTTSSITDAKPDVVLLRTLLLTNIGSNSSTDEGCVRIPSINMGVVSDNYKFTNCSVGNTIFQSCSLQCNNTLTADTLSEEMGAAGGDVKDGASEEIPASTVYTSYQFWWLCCGLVLTYIAMGLVVSVTDAVVYDLLGSERRGEFGLQRLWGTIGWGSISILGGFFNRLASDGQSHQDYSPGFYMFIILMFMDLLVMSNMRVVSESKPPTNILGNMSELFQRPRVVVFMISVYCVGVLTGVLESFLFWYLTDLGADSLQLGLSRGVQCFGGELISFIISGYVIRKIGHVNAMTMVFAGFGVRFIGYSFLTDPWYTLPIELTHGITFGIYYATITSYASIIAPAGMSATLQGLVGGINEGGGMATGSCIGGVVYGMFGGRHTFGGFGIAALCLSLFHAMAQYCGRSWLAPHEKELAVEVGNAEDTKMLPDNIPMEPVPEP